MPDLSSVPQGNPGIGYAGLLSLNIDSCAAIAGPTNGRLDCASGWDGFGFSFHWKVLVWMPDLSSVPQGNPVSDMQVSLL
jgi:hypothetical protein